MESGKRALIVDREQLQQAFDIAKQRGDFENAYKIEQQLKSEPVDYQVTESIKNLPSSAWENLKGMVNAVVHPVDTAKSLGSIGGAGLEKIGRNFEQFYMGESIPPTQGKEDALNKAIEYYKGRVGSVDALKQTAMDDPVGLMLDASTVVSPARMATKSPAITKALATVDPINAAARAGQTALKVIPEGAAAKLYDSAAKFSNRAGFDRNSAIRTALDEGIMPTQKGVRKVEDRIQLLDAELDNLIQEAGASGQKISVAAVEKYIDDLRRAKGGFRLGRGKDVEKINKIMDTWHKDLAELGGGARISRVSPQFIQEFKKSAYGDVNWKAKSPGAKRSQVEEDVYKAMARGAKDEIATAIPQATEINKLLGDLLNLQPELVKAAGRIDKHNLIGLDTSVKTGMGAGIGAASGAPGIGAGIGMALSLLGNPRIKPRIAIALKRLRDGDVNWIDQNIGDPAVRAALSLASHANEIVSAPTYGAEPQDQNPQ